MANRSGTLFGYASCRSIYEAQNVRAISLPFSRYAFAATLGYCFFLGFGITAMAAVGVLELDLVVRFRCLSDWLSPPLCFSANFSQSGMTIALINSCTVISLSSAIFRNLV